MRGQKQFGTVASYWKQRYSAVRSRHKSRTRRLFMEQFEDRRLLAVAADDQYVVNQNQTLTVNGDGAWSNDSYNRSWTESTWNENAIWHDGYWQDPVWQDGYWQQPQWHDGYYDDPVWHDGYWQDPVWQDGYYDENGDWQDGYYDPPEAEWHDGYYDDPVWHDGFFDPPDPVWHDGYWDPPEAEWHDGYWEGQWEDSTAYAFGAIQSQPAHGTLTQIDSGDYYYDGNGNIIGQYGLAFTYTPDAGYQGADSFTYSLTDDQGTSTATVNLVADTAPVANDDDYETAEDVPLNIDSSMGVLANDTDVDGDPLTVSVVSGPLHGSVTLLPNGSFYYVPNLDFHGTDSFTYQSSDGYLTADAIATIDVGDEEEDEEPVLANGDAYSVAAGTGLNVGVAAGVLANDMEVDGDALSAVLTSGTTHGTLTLNANGSFNYSPNSNFQGWDVFTYAATNGTESSDDVTVTIAVGAPTAVNDSYLVTSNSAIQIFGAGVLANDSDPDGNTLSAIQLSLPQHGTVVLNPDGSFNYTPDSDYVGPDSFNYGATDGTLTATGTVALAVNSADPTFAIGINRLGVSAFAPRPPDSMGATGPTQVMEMTNAANSIYDKVTGQLVQPRQSPTSFWNAALPTGQSVTSAYDQRLVYDFATGRWLSCAIGLNSNDSSRAYVLLGVSTTASATDPWKALLIDAYPTRHVGADYPYFGVDADGVYINVHALSSPTRPTVIYVPKADVLAAQPTIAHMRLTESFSTSAPNPEKNMQPVVDFFGGADGRETMFSSDIARSDIISTPGPGTVSFDPISFPDNEVQQLTFSGTIGAGSSFRLMVSAFFLNNPLLTDPIDYPSPFDANTLAQNIQTKLNDLLSPLFSGNRQMAAVTVVSPSVFNVALDPTLAHTSFNGNWDQMVPVSNLNGGSLTVTTLSNGRLPAFTPPLARQPGTSQTIDTHGPEITSSAFQVGHSVWLTWTTDRNGRSAIDWSEIDTTDSSNYIIKQIGLITDPQRDLYYPSIAANPAGDVVIGFSASSPTEYPSAYAAVGHTVAGATTFGALTLLQAGTGNIDLVDSGRTRFGDYSATVPDPSDPYSFWTFQEYAPQHNIWGVNVAQITMTPPTARPQAVNDSRQTSEDVTLSGSSVLANDIDNDSAPDADALTATLVQKPAHGMLVLNSNGTFTYVPDQNFFGNDLFTYWAVDGSKISTIATVTITVTEVNDPPVGVNDSLSSIAEDSTSRTIAISSLLANDSPGPANESNQTLTLTQVSSAVGGTVSISGTNVIFTPAANFNGAASVVYTLQDNGTTNGSADPKTATATVSFTVTEVNDPPLGANDSLSSIAEDSTSRTIAISSLLANDSPGPANESSQTLTLTQVSNAVGGSVSISGTNVIFTPAANFNGVASFVYTLQDNGTTSGAADPKTATATVSFTVTEVNDPPIGVNDSLSSITDESGNRTIAFSSLLANDSAGPANESSQTLTITQVASPVGGSVSISGSNVIFTPTPNFHGTASFVYTLQDNGTTNGAADPKTATSTVSFTIDKPHPRHNTANPMDVNADGYITPMDAQRVIDYINAHPGNGAVAAGDYGPNYPDVDGDNYVAAIDALTIINWINAGHFTAPSFTKGANQTTTDESSAQTFTGWATNLSSGSLNGSGYPLTFHVSADHPEYFNVQPAITSNGTLTYTPKPNAHGTATVTVTLNIDSELAVSAAQTFTILVNKPHPRHNLISPMDVNADGYITPMDAQRVIDYINAHPGNGAVAAGDYGPNYVDVDGDNYVAAIDELTIINWINAGHFTAPSFTKGANQTTTDESSAQTVTGWATNMSSGSLTGSGYPLTFHVTADHPEYFSVQPAIAANGTLTYTPKGNAHGTATMTVTLNIDSELAVSAAQTFTILVNKPHPRHNVISPMDVNGDGYITPGDTQRVIDYINAHPGNGAVAAGDYGPNYVDVDGDNYVAAIDALTIINWINAGHFTAPSFTKGANQTTTDESSAQTVTGWATNLSSGSLNGSGYPLTFHVSADHPEYFNVQPAIAANGTLTYTPKPNAHGTATVTVTLNIDSESAVSAAQTFTILVNKPHPRHNLISPMDVNADGYITPMDAQRVIDYLNAHSAGNGAVAAGDYGPNYFDVDGDNYIAPIDALTIINWINAGNFTAPSFTKGANQTTTDESSAQTVTGWATNVASGTLTGSGYAQTFHVSADHPEYFKVQPAIAANGTLTYTPKPNAHGTATVTVTLNIDSELAVSAAQTFTITVNKPHPRRNIDNLLDVNGDGLVTSQDAQLVTDYINAHGSGPVAANDFGPNYVDTDTDTYATYGYVYSMDALNVINYLNANYNGKVGGIVYVDANGDGIHQSGESGLANVKIHLQTTDAASPAVDLWVLTDANGIFKFSVSGSSNRTLSDGTADPNGVAYNLTNRQFKIWEEEPAGHSTSGNKSDEPYAHMDPNAVDSCIIDYTLAINSANERDRGQLVSFGEW
jgi:VCBS repeat-containing protein